MTGPPSERKEELQLQLAPESVEALARRLAELLAPGLEPAEPGPPRRLLSAAELSRWWGVERSWVYAHADQLGARRLGAGSRPRLRFDPDEVARRLAAPDRSATQPRPAGRRTPRASADSGGLLPIRGDAELSSPHPSRDRPGAAPAPPAAASRTRLSAR